MVPHQICLAASATSPASRVYVTFDPPPPDSRISDSPPSTLLPPSALIPPRSALQIKDFLSLFISHVSRRYPSNFLSCAEKFSPCRLRFPIPSLSELSVDYLSSLFLFRCYHGHAHLPFFTLRIDLTTSLSLFFFSNLISPFHYLQFFPPVFISLRASSRPCVPPPSFLHCIFAWSLGSTARPKVTYVLFLFSPLF